MSLSGKSFIIDPGHGGKYDGVTSGSRKEKTVTLNFSNILKNKLEAEGAKVYMTRTTDKDFGGTNADDDVNKRVNYINQNMPAVSALISIHVNTYKGRIGPFYQEGTVASKAFAQAIAKEYGTVAHEGNFAVLRDTTRASQKTLIEIGQIIEGWLDNTKDLSSTADFVVKGIKAHF